MPVTRTIVAATLPSPQAAVAMRPLDASSVAITGGFWAQRRELNRERSQRHGYEWLERSGALANFRAAAQGTGDYRSLGEAHGIVLPFLDSDGYKWLEAVGWELAHGPDPELGADADQVIALIAAAQRPDGYLNTYVQIEKPGGEYRDLAWGHELYCIGHLVQAALAWHRALGDDRLLDIALRAVASIDRALGPRDDGGIDGHPLLEMALVELYRATADRGHLDLAARLIERRGHGTLGQDRFGSAYWQDHLPVREAPTVAGHAVRQLYLDAGAVDLAVELGDEELLRAVEHRWEDMVASRMYLTGGIGSRHREEAFGDPFELPPDRAYNETCAAIASVLLAWRLLLATGRPRYADLIERVVFNAILGGISLDGTRFSYENPLQRRTHRAAGDSEGEIRTPWKVCACCPPNTMRLISSWEQYQATADASGVSIHQYATGEIEASMAAGTMRLAIETGYPWAGRIAVRVLAAPDTPTALRLRVPSWSRSATVGVEGEERRPAAPGIAELTRRWHPGDVIVLQLDMAPRVVMPDARVDATRGCVAFERGPFVYALESADLPDGIEVEDVTVMAGTAPASEPRDDIAPGVIGLAVPAAVHGIGAVSARLIPYYTWGNRSGEGMRVWIPWSPGGDGDGSHLEAAAAPGLV